MVSGPQGKSRLIKVVATSPGFPYYGKFKTKLGGSTSEKEESMLHQRPTAWVYPELRAQLDIEIGEELKLGEASFRVTDYVLEESGLRFQPAELAPKVFISTNFLDSTKLLAQGNTAFRNLLYKLPEGTDVSKLSFALNASYPTQKFEFSHTRLSVIGLDAYYDIYLIFFLSFQWLPSSSHAWAAGIYTKVSSTIESRIWLFWSA